MKCKKISGGTLYMEQPGSILVDIIVGVNNATTISVNAYSQSKIMFVETISTSPLTQPREIPNGKPSVFSATTPDECKPTVI
jgi:hypothetical protein